MNPRLGDDSSPAPAGACADECSRLAVRAPGPRRDRRPLRAGVRGHAPGACPRPDAHHRRGPRSGAAARPDRAGPGARARAGVGQPAGCTEEACDGHRHHERRCGDLLQGLGQRPSRRPEPRLAAERGQLGGADAVPRRRRLPLRRARPARPRALDPDLGRQRDGHLRRRPRGRDRRARPARRHARRLLHRRRRGRALHRPPRHRPGRAACAGLRRAAVHAPDGRQPGRRADRGVRRHPRGLAGRPLAALPRPGRRPVLRPQPPGRGHLAGHPRRVLAPGPAVRPPQRATSASPPSPRPTSARTSRGSTSRRSSSTATTTRSCRSPSAARRRRR